MGKRHCGFFLKNIALIDYYVYKKGKYILITDKGDNLWDYLII